jgi:toxin FitB
MFLLDTNVVSELRKARAGKANMGVSNWAAGVPAALMFVSVVSLDELEHGVLLAERKDPEKGAVLRAWLDESVLPAFADRVLPAFADRVLPAFADRVLPVDTETALRSAALHVPNPAPFRDAFIAATALVHGMTVVTRNNKDFDRFEDLVVLNPWT